MRDKFEFEVDQILPVQKNECFRTTGKIRAQNATHFVKEDKAGQTALRSLVDTQQRTTLSAFESCRPGEGMLAVGTRNGRVCLVDAATGMTRWEAQSYKEHTFCRVAVSPDGRFVASVGVSEENWKLWDAARGVVCMTGASHDGMGACLCRVTRSGHRTSLDEGCPVQVHTTGPRAVAFSPCGQRLVTGGEDRAVILWDAQTGKAELVMKGHTDMVSSVTFSADGARLASGSWDASIRVWDAATGGLLRAIPNAHGSAVTGVQFSPTDSRTLASVGIENILKQWDVDSGAMKSEFEGYRFAVYSPGGSTLATCSAPGTRDVLMRDAETGALQFRMVGHQGRLTSACWSIDGSKLASGSCDCTCKVWDSSTGALLRTIELGRGVFSLSWGRDWVLEKQRVVAFAMGHHPRLGVGSQVLGLDEELLRMILDRA